MDWPPDALFCSLDYRRLGTRMVRLLGHVDARTSTDILSMVNAHRSATMDRLILDLSELKDFGPDAARILVRIATEAGRVSVGLFLVASDAVVGAALQRAGVRELFELHGSVEEAIAVP
jgi:anti-anti-sigma factor